MTASTGRRLSELVEVLAGFEIGGRILLFSTLACVTANFIALT
jgi:hypothetical protein